jgi:hypothetical protein
MAVFMGIFTYFTKFQVIESRVKIYDISKNLRGKFRGIYEYGKF